MNNASQTTSTVVSILIDDRPVECEAGASVASVLLAKDYYVFSSHPVDLSPRGPFCMMGACQACRVHINGRWQQACLVPVSQGLSVRLSNTESLSASSNVCRTQ